MSYKLFLDDIRTPIQAIQHSLVFNEENKQISEEEEKLYRVNDWIIVRNYDQFVETIITKGLSSIASFDHDLAAEHYENYLNPVYDEFIEKTGYHAIVWLSEYCEKTKQKLPKCYFHTFSSVGRKNMITYYNNAKKHLNL